MNFMNQFINGLGDAYIILAWWAAETVTTAYRSLTNS